MLSLHLPMQEAAADTSSTGSKAADIATCSNSHVKQHAVVPGLLHCIAAATRQLCVHFLLPLLLQLRFVVCAWVAVGVTDHLGVRRLRHLSWSL